MPILASNNDLEYANFEGFDNYENFDENIDKTIPPTTSVMEDVNEGAMDQDSNGDAFMNYDNTTSYFDDHDSSGEQEEEDIDLVSSIQPSVMESFEDGAAQPVNNLLSLDLLLKSILFGLLFYLVAHPDVCNMMKKVFGKLSGEPLRLACMALFVVCYYVINLLI